MQFQRNKYNESQQLEFDEMAESGAKSAQTQRIHTHTHKVRFFGWQLAIYTQTMMYVFVC